MHVVFLGEGDAPRFQADAVNVLICCHCEREVATWDLTGHNAKDPVPSKCVTLPSGREPESYGLTQCDGCGRLLRVEPDGNGKGQLGWGYVRLLNYNVVPRFGKRGKR